MIDPTILPSLSEALGPGYMDIFASINAPPVPATVVVTGGKKKKSSRKKRSPKKKSPKRVNRRRVLRKSRK